MEYEKSLSHSQQPATDTYPERNYSCSHNPNARNLRHILILSTTLIWAGHVERHGKREVHKGIWWGSLR